MFSTVTRSSTAIRKATDGELFAVMAERVPASEEAWAEFYQRYVEDFYQLVCRLRGIPPARTDGLVQDTMMKYKAVAPERARDWWTEKYATVPAIETVESHIIGGAIIPLWQRFKTQEDTRLRVVRVTTEDGQRIVGIQIPRDRVGAVLRSLGDSRDLREPDEIFSAVLNEGEEISLVSNLKLRRGLIHKERVIELCGADPYKFAELRELGLINEQINWKQRFFVPSDGTKGIDILESLLERYPVMLTKDAVSDDESNMVEIPPQSEIRAMEIVDLDQWIVAVGNATPEYQTADGSDRQVEAPAKEATTDETQAFTLTQETAVSWTQFRQSEQTQLPFSFG